MKFAKLVLLSAIVGLTACKKTKKDEDSFHGAGGLCTSGVVHAFNYINTYSTGLSTRSDWQLKEVQTQCTNLRNEMGSASCKAVNTLTGADIWVSYSRAATDCANVSAQITANSKPAAPATPSAPAPAPEFRSGDSCTAEMISAWNTLPTDSFSINNASETKLNEYNTKCDQFKALMDSKYCYAQKLIGSGRMMISYSDAGSVCTAVKTRIANIAAEKAVDATPVSVSAPNEIVVIPELSYSLKSAINYKEYIANGSRSEFKPTGAYCTITGDKAFTGLYSGSVWKLVAEEYGILKIQTEVGTGSAIVCKKAAGDYSTWSLAQLQKVFGKIATFEGK